MGGGVPDWPPQNQTHILKCLQYLYGFQQKSDLILDQDCAGGGDFKSLVKTQSSILYGEYFLKERF